MDVLEIICIVIASLLLIDSGVLIYAVLRQEGTTDGIASVMGHSNTESFLGKNKAKTREGKLALLTKVCVIVLVPMALVFAFLSALL